MPKKYTPATFQPTIRPSWAGILTYISDKEKADILEAIIKFPQETSIESKFWDETIKPDLEEQYEKFIRVCDQRGRGAKTYWGEHKDNISLPYGEHKDNLLKGQGQVKDKDKSELNIGNKTLKGADNPILKLQDNTINVKKVKIEQGKFFMDDTIPEYKEALEGMTDAESTKLWKWIMDRYYGQELPMERIAQMIRKFNKRESA